MLLGSISLVKEIIMFLFGVFSCNFQIFYMYCFIF